MESKYLFFHSLYSNYLKRQTCWTRLGVVSQQCLLAIVAAIKEQATLLKTVIENLKCLCEKITVMVVTLHSK